MAQSVMRRVQLYHLVKPLIPRWVQVRARQLQARWRRRHAAAVWPILESSRTPPEGWAGWPDGRRFAFVLTHDVEGSRGHDRCRTVMDVEAQHGFRSSFNLVPDLYAVSADLRDEIGRRGWELAVHGLRHDASLFWSRRSFTRQAAAINQVLKDWGAVGFRSPYMIRNLDWIADLDIEYDASTFDTDPFELQPEGAGTVFPFFVSAPGGGRRYVELPYSLPQDLNLFVLLGERGIETWKRKLDWVAEAGGMALLDTHPDYMALDGGKSPACDEYPVAYYAEFLDYVRTRYAGQYWHALPRDVARFWRTARGGGGEAPKMP